jgi:hypothetical protein
MEPTTLSNGKVGIASMGSYNFAKFIHKDPFANSLIVVIYLLLNKPTIIIIRDKADFVGVGLVGHRQEPFLFGKGSYLRFPV